MGFGGCKTGTAKLFRRVAQAQKCDARLAEVRLSKFCNTRKSCTPSSNIGSTMRPLSLRTDNPAAAGLRICARHHDQLMRQVTDFKSLGHGMPLGAERALVACLGVVLVTGMKDGKDCDLGSIALSTLNSEHEICMQNLRSLLILAGQLLPHMPSSKEATMNLIPETFSQAFGTSSHGWFQSWQLC